MVQRCGRDQSALTRRSRSAIAAILLVMALLAAACGSDDTASSSASDDTASSSTSSEATELSVSPQVDEGLDPKPLAERASIKVVTSGFIEPFLPPFLAAETGEFDKENLDVEFVVQPSPAGLTLLATNEVQVQLVGVSASFLNAAAAGAPVVWVAGIHTFDPTKQGFWVRTEYLNPDGSLNREKAKGMKINAGVGGLGNGGVLPVWEYFKDNGINFEDLELVTLNTPNDVAVALETGAIGAGLLLTPFWRDADAKGFAKLVASQGFVASVYAANSDFLEEKPDVAEAFFRAISRTIATNLKDDYKADPDMVALVAKTLQVPTETVAGTPSLGFDPRLPFFDEQVVKSFEEMWFELGDVLDYSEPVDVDTIIDRSAVDRALSGG